MCRIECYGKLDTRSRSTTKFVDFFSPLFFLSFFPYNAHDRSFSQFQCFKIRRSSFLNYMQFLDPRILSLQYVQSGTRRLVISCGWQLLKNLSNSPTRGGKNVRTIYISATLRRGNRKRKKNVFGDRFRGSQFTFYFHFSRYGSSWQ